MKKLSVMMLVLFTVSIISSNLSAQEIKLGYVDTVKLFSQYSETVEAEKIYKKEVEAWRKKASEMEAEIARLREEIQSQSLMLSQEKLAENQEKLAEKKLQLEQKFKEYQQYMGDIFGEEGEAAKRNKELTQPIVEKINAVIAKIAEEEGYTMIFDSSQGNILYAKKAMDLTDKVMIFDSSQGNILYAKKAMDLTDKVLERLEGQLQSTQ